MFVWVGGGGGARAGTCVRMFVYLNPDVLMYVCAKFVSAYGYFGHAKCLVVVVVAVAVVVVYNDKNLTKKKKNTNEGSK